MTTIKVKLMEPIAGYEAEAEIRHARKGESYLGIQGGVRKAKANTRHTEIILTPKVSQAEKMGLEVGAVYHHDTARSWQANPYLVTEDGLVELEETGGDFLYTWSVLERRLHYFNSHLHRKVINADGTMVDGDIEWVTVGGKEVTKADLRAACAEVACDTPACQSHAKTCCVCDGF